MQTRLFCLNPNLGVCKWTPQNSVKIVTTEIYPGLALGVSVPRKLCILIWLVGMNIHHTIFCFAWMSEVNMDWPIDYFGFLKRKMVAHFVGQKVDFSFVRTKKLFLKEI